MRLTRFTDFGLRVLMRLAGAPGQSFTVEAMATEFRISREHLTKVVRELARAGFVQTQRGAAGGFRLAMEPAAIRIGAVTRALEARHALVECFQPTGSDCTLLPRCRLKARLASAREAFFADLDRSTLADCLYSPDRGTRAA
ncbi:MAG: Rrf2 family transcriptional regulator [Beijerinckiaceae bacterium]|jgi:Rrf2 family nitric oxide-sensitive transcriptional repressor|nr:Rrf2 family transcriptional regulator [Beijerinckiaceae bacterium]